MEYGKKTENHWKMRNINLTTWKMTKSLKDVKNENAHSRPGIWRENWKSRKMRNTQFRTWNMASKTDKVGKLRNVHCRTWNMARKLKNMENEKDPLDDMKKWRNHWKTWKKRNAHCRTWNMARKLKITENEKYTL